MESRFIALIVSLSIIVVSITAILIRYKINSNKN